MEKKTVNGLSALKSGFEPDVVVLDEATAMNTNPFEAEQLQKNDIRAPFHFLDSPVFSRKSLF